jgi:hypothetical protein
MTSSGRNKMLVSLVVILLITNFVVLYFLLESNNELNKSRDEKQVDYMKKELGLSQEQTEKYKALRSYRDSLLQPLNDSLRIYKLKMIGFLQQPAASVPDSLVRQTAVEISNRQQDIEVEFYQHFRRVQAICQPAQLPLFDSVLLKMVYRTTGKNKNQR